MVEGPSFRVAIVDDDRLLRRHLELLLTAIGHRVVGEGTWGQEAVTLAREVRPDVLVLDVAMPDMDGIEAARIIQREYPTPIVIVSGSERQSTVLAAAEAGVGAYVVKPATQDELARAIWIAHARHADLMQIRRLLEEADVRNAELAALLAEVQTLQEIVPMCMYCHKVRDDRGFWQRVESYIRRRSGVDISHGICPECRTERFPGVAWPPDMP